MTGRFAATVKEEGGENGDRLDWFDPFPPDLVVLLKPAVLRLGRGLSGDGSVQEKGAGCSGCPVLR